MELERPEHVLEAISEITSPSVPGPLMSTSHSGVVKTRAHVGAGRRWSETYGAINTNRPETHKFLATIRKLYANGESFETLHMTAPGSGQDHLGSADSGLSITISGSGQTGSSITTTGWPTSTNGLLLPGTLIKISGINRTFEVTDDVDSDGSGNADISISPSIFTGLEPSDGASVSYNDVLINAFIGTSPNMPSLSNAFWYSGLQLQFVEDV